MKIALDKAFQNRHYDSDGMLRIEKTPISKATVNPYYGHEIPDAETLGLDADKVYYLLRDPSELSKAAETFRTKPLMFEHIPVSAEDPQQESVAGTIGSNVSFESPYLIADLEVWDADAIDGIEKNVARQLSASYRYRADMTPGMYEGQRYDGVMRDIEGNHVALVPAGRAGSDVMAADGQLEKPMKETKFGKAVYAMLRASSAKLAKDSRLKPLVIGLTPAKCSAKPLTAKLLAMDADLREKDTEEALDAMKADTKERIREGRKERAEDRRRAKDADEDDLDENEEREEDEEEDLDDEREDDDEQAEREEDGEQDEDEEEDDERAEDARRIASDDFDGLVEKLQKKGYSKKYATAIAGKVAKEKGDIGKAHDKRAKDAQTAREKAMWAQMRKDGTADDPADDAKIHHAMDEFKRELREADEARRDVRGVVGEVLAQDSASGIYKFALDEMRVDRKGVKGVAALRALFRAAQPSRANVTPQIAFDSASVDEVFPGASRNIQVM